MNISGLIKIDDSPEEPDNADEFDDMEPKTSFGGSRRPSRLSEPVGSEEPTEPTPEPEETAIDKANDAAYNDFVNSTTSEVPQ